MYFRNASVFAAACAAACAHPAPAPRPPVVVTIASVPMDTPSDDETVPTDRVALKGDQDLAYYCFTTFSFDHVATCGGTREVCDLIRAIHERAFSSYGLGSAILPCERHPTVYCFRFFDVDGAPAEACYPTRGDCEMGRTSHDPSRLGTQECVLHGSEWGEP